MKKIKDNNSSELIVKKSKFICDLVKIINEEDAKETIKSIKSKYHDARHNCYAYRVYDKEQKRIIEGFSDDGEPSGTAGKPMLELLRGEDLCNCLAVVTRYFGGILLGTGGLVKAYSDVTKETIKKTSLIESKLGLLYEIEVEYDNIDKIMFICEKEKIEVINREYGVNIIFTLKSDEDKYNIILNQKILNNKIIEKDIFI